MTAQADIPPLKPSFYMRPLPTEKLIGYETAEGKALFKQALDEGGLEAFFPLSQQFLTQSEPAYCGIGTLCMILNALRVDPKVTFRHPWRWFSEDMLDCCRPLEWVKQHGITLPEFSCLARCNGLQAATRFADQTPFEDFEKDVIACSKSDSQFMAVSYSRASLGQTGTGHFSPAGGYTSANGGMVLILDVARFKYPSYWVPIRLLYDSLLPIDAETGYPRGYSILRRHLPSPTPTLLTLNATPQTWPTLYTPLLSLASSAPSYTTLLSSLSTLLGGPTGLPAVASRLDIQSLSTTAGSETPEGLSSYHDDVASFYEHVATVSSVYRELEGADEIYRTEVTVFVLALFCLQDFLECLAGPVREEVRRRVKEDLEDQSIGAEVGVVRVQMEGMVTCGEEEEAGGCAGSSGCCKAR